MADRSRTGDTIRVDREPALVDTSAEPAAESGGDTLKDGHVALVEVPPSPAAEDTVGDVLDPDSGPRLVEHPYTENDGLTPMERAERSNKAASVPDNKAIQGAPENKSVSG